MTVDRHSGAKDSAHVTGGDAIPLAGSDDLDEQAAATPAPPPTRPGGFAEDDLPTAADSEAPAADMAPAAGAAASKPKPAPVPAPSGNVSRRPAPIELDLDSPDLDLPTSATPGRAAPKPARDRGDSALGLDLPTAATMTAPMTSADAFGEDLPTAADLQPGKTPAAAGAAGGDDAALQQELAGAFLDGLGGGLSTGTAERLDVNGARSGAPEHASLESESAAPSLMDDFGLVGDDSIGAPGAQPPVTVARPARGAAAATSAAAPPRDREAATSASAAKRPAVLPPALGADPFADDPNIIPLADLEAAGSDWQAGFIIEGPEADPFAPADQPAAAPRGADDESSASPHAAAAPKRRKARWVVALVTAGVLAIAGAGGYFGWRLWISLETEPLVGQPGAPRGGADAGVAAPSGTPAQQWEEHPDKARPTFAQPTPAATGPLPGGTTTPGSDAGSRGAVATAPAPARDTQVVALTTDNVDQLGFEALSSATAALRAQIESSPRGKPAAAQNDLLLWALWRLAYRFKDAQAQASLAQQAHPQPEKPAVSPMAAAASLGSMLLSGHATPAKRAAARLRRKAGRDAHLALALGLVYAAWGPRRLAASLLARAESMAPHLVDVALARAELLLGSQESDAGAQRLMRLGQTNDVDLTVQAATALLQARAFSLLPETVAALRSVDQASQVAPARRDDFYRLLIRKALRSGDVRTAMAASTARIALDGASVKATIGHARILAAAGADADAFLTQRLQAPEAPSDKAQIIVEQVRQRLAAGAPDAARAAVKAATTLPPRTTAGWLKVATGLIAQAAGQQGEAMTAYKEAVDADASLVEPQVRLVLLEVREKSKRLVKLTQLARQTQEPFAQYHLALALVEQGDFGGAARRLDALLWNAPTAMDPIDLLLTWVDVQDRAGEALTAEAWAERISDNLPDQDERAIMKIIAMSKRGGRTDSVVKWIHKLLDRRPNHGPYSVLLAATLTDAGRAVEAQQLLDGVLKVNPELRSAELLHELGRSWIERDVVKATGTLLAAIKLKPMTQTFMLLGEIEQARGRNDEALDAYRKALQIDPDLLEARMRLTKSLIAKGFLREATQDLRALIEKHPDNAEAAELLGDVLAEMDNPADAVGAYQQASGAKGASDAGLLMKIARLQLQALNQLAPAMQTFRHIIQIAPETAEAYYYLGYALKDLGKPAAARAALQKYLRLAPNGEFASEVRDDVQHLGGR